MTDDRIAEESDGPIGEDEDDPGDVADVDDGGPIAAAKEAVGDGRQKYVEVVTSDGERHEHGDSYLRQSAETFIISTEPGFPPAETVTYSKDEVDRVTVEQHHSACFITTAVAGEERTLADLRGFRDEVMTPSSVGRPLVGLYERISPPIAATLADRPDGATARTVRSLVRGCAELARRREAATPPTRAALSAVLVVLYVVGVLVAATGHAAAAVGLVGSREQSIE